MRSARLSLSPSLSLLSSSACGWSTTELPHRLLPRPTLPLACPGPATSPPDLHRLPYCPLRTCLRSPVEPARRSVRLSYSSVAFQVRGRTVPRESSLRARTSWAVELFVQEGRCRSSWALRSFLLLALSRSVLNQAVMSFRRLCARPVPDELLPLPPLSPCLPGRLPPGESRHLRHLGPQAVPQGEKTFPCSCASSTPELT